MNVIEKPCRTTIAPITSAATRQTNCDRFEPMFIADWDCVLMIHFAVDAEPLQRDVRFQLDLKDGQAYVTLVAFTMRGMRPAIGGRLTAWAFHPIATHHFLNVRTYVRVGEEAGIHFLTEWIPNRIAMLLGPCTFSLPYRHGRINYQNEYSLGVLNGCVVDMRTGTSFAYRADLKTKTAFVPCETGTLEHWLMERYVAFNSLSGRQRYFRVWHEPWRQCGVTVSVEERSLLLKHWPWFGDARQFGANYSPGSVRSALAGRIGSDINELMPFQ